MAVVSIFFSIGWLPVVWKDSCRARRCNSQPVVPILLWLLPHYSARRQQKQGMVLLQAIRRRRRARRRVIPRSIVCLIHQETEIVFSVVIADVGNDLTRPGYVVGQFAVRISSPKQVAQYPPEIFRCSGRKKTAAVGEHAQ